MGDKKSDALQVTCPHCHSLLHVDATTGDVLYSKKHEKRDVESFDKAVELAREKEKQRSGLFEEAIELERKRKELLEKKFKEAQKNSSDDDTPPASPFDFD